METILFPQYEYLKIFIIKKLKDICSMHMSTFWRLCAHIGDASILGVTGKMVFGPDDRLQPSKTIPVEP
jgi:hypothetical protein